MERTFTRRDGTVGEVRRADGTAIGVGPEPTKKPRIRRVFTAPFRLATTAEIILSNLARKRRENALKAAPRAVKPASDRLKYGDAF